MGKSVQRTEGGAGKETLARTSRDCSSRRIEEEKDEDREERTK